MYISGNGPNAWTTQSDIEDAPIQQIETVILKDRHESELQIVRKLGVSFGSVVKIIYDQMHM